MYINAMYMKKHTMYLREGSQKKNVKVWSLTKLADPPSMVKYGLLIVKIFSSIFFGYQSVSNLINGILGKNNIFVNFLPSPSPLIS